MRKVDAASTLNELNDEQNSEKELGNDVLLGRREFLFVTFMAGINGFTEDIFKDGRDQGNAQDVTELT